MEFTEALSCETKQTLRDDDLTTLGLYRAKNSKHPTNRQKTAMRDILSQKQQKSNHPTKDGYGFR